MNSSATSGWSVALNTVGENDFAILERGQPHVWMAHPVLIAFSEVFMANSPSSFASGDAPRSPRLWPSEVPNPLSIDAAIWDHLKNAIAASSGFQSWELEGGADEALQTLSLDHRVQRYLRETLETLAY